LIAHTGRTRIVEQTRAVGLRLLDAGFEVRMERIEATDTGLGDRARLVSGFTAAEGAEIVIVLGGDGTFLRASEFARPAGVPLLGVNLGHVGFLAETDPADLDDAIGAVIACDYDVEQRLTLDVEIRLRGEVVERNWALNEASVEKSARERMLELAVAVDDVELLRFGCDGVLCATPTGSTAYAFSAGGPIVWPNVEALLVVPNAAHALFKSPLVIAPNSTIRLELLRGDHPGVLSCDGRRSSTVDPEATVHIQRSELPMRIVRLRGSAFAPRLVQKFHLPVKGFRDGGSLHDNDRAGPATIDD
jgi:NAD+ kinase